MKLQEPNSTIRVTSWNIKDGLSDPDRSPLLVSAIRDLASTAVVLCEAYDVNRTTNLDNVREDFDKMGYSSIDTPQEIGDNRPDQHGIMLLAKREVMTSMEVIQLAGRNALRALMYDHDSDRYYQMIGHHGNDKSPRLRKAATMALAPYLHYAGNDEIELPAVYAGDLNAMKGSSLVARALRAVHPFTYLLPSAPPDPVNPPKGLRRIGSLARRVSGMPDGTMKRLADYGLLDTDPEDTPTISERGLSVKIDHIMVSKHFNVASHTVFERNAAEEAGLYKPASDHRAISADLRLVG